MQYLRGPLQNPGEAQSRQPAGCTINHGPRTVTRARKETHRSDQQRGVALCKALRPLLRHRKNRSAARILDR